MAKRTIVRYHSSRPSRDFITNLRIHVAKALTESLPPELQKDIFPHVKDASATQATQPATGPSIAEAVAAARREEAQKYDQRWKKERESVIREAEEAARARVESDLVLKKRQLAFEQWKQEVEQQNSSETEDTKHSSQTQESKSEQSQLDHPILGPCLLDLGYKRVYLAPTSSLVNIPVWEKQRIYRHDRAKLMVADKMKTLDLGLPGVITIHEDSESSQLTILDGQHRIGMLSLMAKKEEPPLFIDSVLVELYSSGKTTLPKELFLEINKAEPVKLVDMPGIAKSSDRQTLADAASSLRDVFPDMFKPSQRCRAPHLNIDNLRDALFAGKVLERHSIKSPSALYDWMIAQNELLAQQYQSDAAAQSRVAPTALEKALKHKFFLGLDSSWYYN